MSNGAARTEVLPCAHVFRRMRRFGGVPLRGVAPGFCGAKLWASRGGVRAGGVGLLFLAAGQHVAPATVEVLRRLPLRLGTLLRGS